MVFVVIIVVVVVVVVLERGGVYARGEERNRLHPAPQSSYQAGVENTPVRRRRM